MNLLGKKMAKSKQEQANVGKKPMRVIDTPPWYKEGCKACGEHPGFNSKGNPCRICDDRGGITSEMFNIDTDGDGGATWDAKPEYKKRLAKIEAEEAEEVEEEEEEAEEEQPKKGKAPIAAAPKGKPKVAVEEDEDEEETEEVEEEEETPKRKAKPAVEEDEDEDEEETEEVEEEEEETPKRKAKPTIEEDEDETEDEDEGPGEEAEMGTVKRGRGRPRASFTLYIGCVPVRGYRKPIYLEGVVAAYGAQLAKAQEVESYYELDAFKRRDALCKVAPHIVKEFDTNDVFVPRNAGPDVQALLTAIRPFAGRICEALA